jgi:hypothetical protein
LAYTGTPKNPRTKRHPLWNIDQLKEDLAAQASTLTQICKRYSPDENKWRALYADVKRWEKEDPELAQLLLENRQATDSKKRKNITGGRPSKDSSPENSDWRLRYCEELLKTKSRIKSSLVTPYSADEIYQRLNDKYTSYDKDFAEMVHLTEMQLVAWAEEEIWNALEDAQHPKDRAWIAKEILKVRDRPRWGDKLDVNVQSKHTHTHILDRGKVLAELEADRREYFEIAEQKRLDVGIVDVEVIG